MMMIMMTIQLYEKFVNIHTEKRQKPIDDLRGSVSNMAIG